MNTIQTAISSLLVIAFLAALPGVYLYTEGTFTSPEPPRNVEKEDAAKTASSDNSSSISQVEPVPKPSRSQLPESNFTLHQLSEGEKRSVMRKIMIDVNTASKSQLQRIDGIGSSTAERIIQYRKEQGGIRSLEDLDQVSGIGPATIEKLKSQVKVGGRLPDGTTINVDEPSGEESQGTSSSGAADSKIAINSAGSSELQKIDGVGPATAEGIINFRNEKGPIQNLEQLDNVDGIGPATLEKFRGRVTFN